jgi:3-hydroxyisobutyrate dehydrogenase-like beta-hydroxyacid dehydrogenase
MKAGVYEGKSGAIDTFTKDSRIIMEAGMELDVPLWISSIPYHLFRVAASRGLNRHDPTAVVKVYEEYAGVKVADC